MAGHAAAAAKAPPPKLKKAPPPEAAVKAPPPKKAPPPELAPEQSYKESAAGPKKAPPQQKKAPPQLKKAPPPVPAVICPWAHLTIRSKSACVRMSCNNPRCTWRSVSTRLAASSEEPANIGEDDKVDLLGAMLDEKTEAGEVDENDG